MREFGGKSHRRRYFMMISSLYMRNRSARNFSKNIQNSGHLKRKIKMANDEPKITGRMGEKGISNTIINDADFPFLFASPECDFSKLEFLMSTPPMGGTNCASRS